MRHRTTALIGAFFLLATTRGSSELGDFTGMPVTPQAIAHADAWDESRWTLQERQCIPHSP